MIRILLAVALLLQACASHDPPAAKLMSEVLSRPYPALADEVEALTNPAAERLQLLEDRHLLHQEMTPQLAQQIALLGSPAIAEALAELGIAQADALQAGLMSNPGLSLSLLRPDEGGRWQVDAGISLSLLDWFTQPLRRRLSAAASLQAQLQLAQRLDDELEAVALDYFTALARRERLFILRTNLDAARAASSLARAMFDAGNISELALLQHQSELQRLQGEVWSAENLAQEASILLGTRLGLSAQDLLLPNALPAFQGDVATAGPQLVTAARDREPRILLAAQQVAWSEQNLALTERQAPWVRFEPGLAYEREDDSSARGIGVELGLPLFDQGQGRLAGAQARLSLAQAQQARQLTELEGRIARALDKLQSASTRVQFLQQDAIPQHERMLVLGLQEYNFMLSDAFALLQIKQAELDVRLAAVDALADYWQAQVQLAAATGIPLEISVQETPGSAEPDASTPDSTAPGGHQHD